jgi:hypothetical protein
MNKKYFILCRSAHFYSIKYINRIFDAAVLEHVHTNKIMMEWENLLDGS